MKTHKDLDAWKHSMELVTDIYTATKHFPKEEIYGLTNQIRRAAVSIPSNIAEGAARNHKKEFIQFLYIALGSLSELDTQIQIACNLKFTNQENYDSLLTKIKRINALILGLIKYLESKTE